MRSVLSGSTPPDELFWLEGWLHINPHNLSAQTIADILDLTSKLLHAPLSSKDDLNKLNGNDLGLQNLVDDWGEAVQSLFDVIDNTINRVAGVNFDDSNLISVMVFLRNQLQTLYSNLLITVTQQQPLVIVV
jgi:hypothetical protein